MHSIPLSLPGFTGWFCRVLLFLYHMNFQIIKINGINKMILAKPDLIKTLEFPDRGFQPDRRAQIELQYDFIQCRKNFIRSTPVTVIADHGILDHTIVFPYFSP